MKKVKTKSKFKVYYSEFTKTKDIDKVFSQCADLIRIKHLLDIGLITVNEYEKIRNSIGIVADL